MRQILFNIISNACKFTNRGTIHIESTSHNQNTQDYFKVLITNNGIGIPQEHIERLFEAFTQVDGSYSRRHEGTGLGLTICNQLCSLMHGEICISSNPNEGSTFCFSLPVDLNKAKHLPSVQQSPFKVAS